MAQYQAQPQKSPGQVHQSAAGPNPMAAPFTPSSFAPAQPPTFLTQQAHRDQTPSQEQQPASSTRPSFSAAAPSFTPSSSGPSNGPHFNVPFNTHRSLSGGMPQPNAPEFVPMGMPGFQSTHMTTSASQPSSSFRPNAPSGLHIPIPQPHGPGGPQGSLLSPSSATSPGLHPMHAMSPLPGPQHLPMGSTSPHSMHSPNPFQLQGSAIGSGNTTPQPQHLSRSNSFGAASIVGQTGQGPPIGSLTGTNGYQRPQRKQRGPPPTHTPLKTTGHNSKPSVSLNPAAFTAALAEHNANKSKRKIVVSLPKEIGNEEQQQEQEDIEQLKRQAELAAREEGKDEDTVAKKARQVVSNALIRRAWFQRQPVEASNFINSIPELIDEAHLCSIDIYPEPRSAVAGLPDTIDIYLPGQAAWIDYKEMRAEEREHEMELFQEPNDEVHPGGAWSSLRMDEMKAHERASSMSSPADPSAVSSRLEKLVDRQHQFSESEDEFSQDTSLRFGNTVGQPSGLVSSENAETEMTSFRFGGASSSSSAAGRAQGPLPASLFKRAPETPTRGEKTMSLSMPSSGGPFASAALMALGIPSPVGGEGDDQKADRGAHSDGEMSSAPPALGARPPFIARSGSAPGGATGGASARSSLSSSSGANDSPSSSRIDHASKPSWKDLGAGFGYELEDVVEESSSAMHSRNPSHQMQSVHQDDEIEDDLRTNPSEDADTSEAGDVDDEDASRTWGPTINFDQSADSDENLDPIAQLGQEYGSDDDDSQGNIAEEQYSNPSDEEAARREQLNRRALQAERNIGAAVARSDVRNQNQGLTVDHIDGQRLTGRPRADTADTYASSSLHPEGEYAHGPSPDQGGAQRSAQRGQHRAYWPQQEEHTEEWDYPDNRAAVAATDKGGVSFGSRNNGPIDGPDSPQSGRNGSADYRFPASVPSATGRLAAGRLASGLNPTAKEFVFGANGIAGGTRQAHVSSEAGQEHFRLPSIQNSSFGGSAFGQETASFEGQQQRISQAQVQQHSAHDSRRVSAGGSMLSAAAPSFNPTGTFTFAAPVGAPRLPQSFLIDGVSNNHEGAARDEQGREKRSRTKAANEGDPDETMKERGEDGIYHGEFQYADDSYKAENGVQDYLEGSGSPARPGPGPASIEGGLRDVTGTFTGRPPPFNSRGLPPYFAPPPGTGINTSPSQAREPSFNASLRPSAPAFMPTWAKSATNQKSRQSRPGTPTFDGPEDVDLPKPSATQAPTSDFTFSMASKAIPIRAPESEEKPLAEEDLTLDATEVSSYSQDDDENQENQQTFGTLSRIGGKMPAKRITRRTPLLPVANERSRGAIAIPGTSPTHAANSSSSGTFGGSALRRPSHLTREHRLSREHRSSRSSRSGQNVSSDVEESEAESETFQDIIDELASRMDQSLDAWCGRILDEVTLAGQLRPVIGGGASNTASELSATISDRDRNALLDSLLVGIKDIFSIHLSSLQGDLLKGHKELAIEAAKSAVSSQSDLAVAAVSRSRRNAHGELDAQGELDFDYVTDVLDQKVSNLKRDLLGAIDTALPRALKEADSTQSRKSTDLPKSVDSSTSTEQLAEALAGRLNPLFEKTRETLSTQSRSELEELLKRLLSNSITSAFEAGEQRRSNSISSLFETIDKRMSSWENNLSEMRDHLPEHVQVGLINGIIPHLDSFVTKQEPQVHIAGSDPDVVAARVTEILAPMISDNREARRERELSDDREQVKEREEERKSREAAVEAALRAVDAAAESVAKQSAVDPAILSEDILQKILPSITSIKTEPIDTQGLVDKISEVVGRQSIEHLVDLNPITALLEPLVAKQEDVRSISQKLLTRQQDVESLLSDLPTLVGAKVDALHSARDRSERESRDASGEHHESQSDVKDLLRQLLAKVGSLQDGSDTALEQARQEAIEQKTEATEIRAELIAAGSYSSTLKDEVVRLEKGADELLAQTKLLRVRESEANAKAHAAEARATEAIHQLKDVEASRDDANTRCSLLQSHNEQLTNELKESREERARERESAAQATAEVMARLVSAEKAVADAQARVDEKDRAAEVSHSVLQDEVKAAVQRAAKAEGELSGLQKRVNDQDSKLANLQSLTATQKQKTAESQQKLAEASKRREEYQSQAQERAVALARVKDMEERLANKEALEERLHAAESAKSQLREEISQYHDRFLDLERDLIAMKERFVGREEMEACQHELALSREETAQLKGQLAERDRIDAQRQEAEQQEKRRIGMRGSNASRYADAIPSQQNAWDDPSEQSQSMSRSQAEMQTSQAANSTTWGAGSSAGEETSSSSLTTDGGYTILRKSELAESQPGKKVDGSAAPSIVVSAAPGLNRGYSTSSNKFVQKTDDGWWT
ncbi:unnamed protein product [Sympodiomycopsis kandeliae]